MLSPIETRALAERLRDSTIARPEAEGLDLFAHDMLHQLETALDRMTGSEPPRS